MALYTKSGGVIPSDAVKLTRGDAITFQRNLFQSWKNGREVFFLKYGPAILSAAATGSGFYFNNYFRQRLRLQSFARLSTYLPAVVVPTVATYLLQTKCQDSLIIQEYQCPVCLEIKSVSLQLMTGVLYPASLASIAGFMMATRYMTYDVPVVHKDPKAIWNLFLKLSRPMYPIALGMTVAHTALAALITYKQADNIDTMNTQLMKFEEKMRNT